VHAASAGPGLPQVWQASWLHAGFQNVLAVLGLAASEPRLRGQIVPVRLPSGARGPPQPVLGASGLDDPAVRVGKAGQFVAQCAAEGQDVLRLLGRLTGDRMGCEGCESELQKP
jgi:hypothetical protein